MSRLWNFSAGPAALPTEVLEQMQSELPEWQEAGASVMEISHRSKAFTRVIEGAEADLRELLNLPRNYRVLFLQGGATLQFTQAPLNLLQGGSADYLVTGAWSQKAAKEAARLGNVRIVSAREPFIGLPAVRDLRLSSDAAYLHLCTNETIHGVELFEESITALATAVGNVPLVADMSSHLLSRPMALSRFGLLYAGAQKNIGPAGLTLVIIRDDLLGKASAQTPALLDYRMQAKNGSMLNTPPTFAIYAAGLVFQWLKRQGGLAAIAAQNKEKADHLYAAIAASDGFYRNPVLPEYRSRMNIPFTLPTLELEAEFVRASEAAGFIGLKGHKFVGGIRASLYNAVPLAAVQALVAFMRDFALARADSGAIETVG
ncbi:MAG: 3-phosphoserine/phosphohydroxythreonine transaminase [Zoogloeaceae bacterium]|jgi:phosphoserine aminotransferase|nr:3-phosphoserine/phosphohydroxythreonine transaminase [Zoogloeaceae bacterium]